jgi:hypothetical protein
MQGPQRPNSKSPKATGLPRGSEQPNRQQMEFDHTSPEFQAQYEAMSPKMKNLLRGLGSADMNTDPQDSLNNGMANLGLGASARQSPPSRLAAALKGFTPRPLAVDSEEEEELEDDDDDDDDYDDSAAGNLQEYRSSYVHNDNRVITTNVNSNNVNTENVVDSYNDNSTRTDIKKTRQ